MNNFYTFPLPGDASAPELFESILTGSDGLLVERIVSHGQTSPDKGWYDQEKDEWVLVLEGAARLRYEDGSELALSKGDHVLLPRHVKHKVVYTSSPCVWLAVYAGELRQSGPDDVADEAADVPTMPKLAGVPGVAGVTGVAGVPGVTGTQKP